MEALAATYAERGVEFLHFYVREPHPGEKAFKQYLQPSSFEEKLAYAKELEANRGIRRVTVAVDGMEEQAHRKFGRLPNMAYVVDTQGTIVFKAMWTRAEEIEKVLQELLREEASRPAPTA